MDDVIKSCKARIREFDVGNWRLQLIRAGTVAFADYVSLLSGTEEKLQRNLDVLVEELKRRGLKVSLAKTKTMVVASEPVGQLNTR